MNYAPLPADTFPFEVTYAVVDASSKPANAGTTSFNVSASAIPELKLLVGDADKTFPLASVTKPIAAYAVLVGVAQGDFGLTDSAGPVGATLAHLLAHASGLPAEKGAPIASPGKRRIYSNYGFDVLAQWVEMRTSVPIEEYIQRNVLRPLGMDTTRIPGSIAYSGISTLDSLIRFAAELLSPTLLPTDLFTRATNIVFDGISGILPGYGRQKNNAWGLGFEIRDKKTPHWLADTYSAHSFGHFGQSGSFIWVDPEIHRAGVFLSAEKFGDAHIARWPELTAQMRAI